MDAVDAFIKVKEEHNRKYAPLELSSSHGLGPGKANTTGQSGECETDKNINEATQ